MPESQIQPTQSVPPIQPTVQFNKASWTPLIVLIIVVALAVCWLAPSYESIKKENESLKTENLSLKSQVSKNTNTITYYPNGHIKSSTSVVFQKKTSELDNTKDMSKTSYSKVTERGLTSIAILFGSSLIPKGATISTSIIGPIGAEGMFLLDGTNLTILAGPKLSF